MFILSSLLFGLVTIASHGQGKGVAVSLELNKASVVDCIRTIEQQTDYTFIFDDSVVATGTVTFSCSNMPLEDVLRRIFTPRGVGFELTGKQILLKKPERKTAQVTLKTISGIIKDESGQPLPGVAVVDSRTKNGVSSDLDGKYSVEVPYGETELMFMCLGFADMRVTVPADRQTVDVCPWGQYAVP